MYCTILILWQLTKNLEMICVLSIVPSAKPLWVICLDREMRIAQIVASKIPAANNQPRLNIL